MASARVILKQVASFRRMKASRSSKTAPGKTAVFSERTTRTKAIVGRTGKGNTAKSKANKTDDVQYVFPLGNGWVVKGANAATFIAIADSKTEAISIPRTLARTKQTNLIVHGKNGAVEIKESYTV